MDAHEVLVKRFKNESVAVYEIEHTTSAGTDVERSKPLLRYVVSTNGTRNLLNFPEIVNRRFIGEMRRGLSNAFIGLDRLEYLSKIPSRSVNIFHILRGGLNFQLVDVLQSAYGYKWHSSSFVSSQRVKVGADFDIEDDAYRKFVVPQNPTIYTGDIVATGASINNAITYLSHYLKKHGITLSNFVFVTIGGKEVEPILSHWHERFRELFPGYDRTILVYIEGRFVVAAEEMPIETKVPKTDLIRNCQLGSLHTPEFEYSQFEKLIIPLEACVIYDGGKKSFEPIHHLQEIRGFWQRQKDWAERAQVSLWDEYNNRFPLDAYFTDEQLTEIGTPETLAEKRSDMWWGLDGEDYEHLFRRFRWLWTDERLSMARRLGSFISVCTKKLQYLDSHIHG